MVNRLYIRLVIWENKEKKNEASQLGTSFTFCIQKKTFEPPGGLEPPTHALRMRCSTN